MIRGIGRTLAALALGVTLAASGASSQAVPAHAGTVLAHPTEFMMGPGCGASSG